MISSLLRKWMLLVDNTNPLRPDVHIVQVCDGLNYYGFNVENVISLGETDVNEMDKTNSQSEFQFMTHMH